MKRNIRTVDTIADLKNIHDTLPTIWVSGYYNKNDRAFGDNVFIWNPSKLKSGSNNGTIISPVRFGDDVTKGVYELTFNGAIFIKWFGVTGDSSDETLKTVNALNALNNGDTLDFNNLKICLFRDTFGTPSRDKTNKILLHLTDASPLSNVPRLYNKKNITLKNGELYAHRAKVSKKKVLYPTTLSIDRCTNITLENLVLHSKGESYGDADAAKPLEKNKRINFSIQNGGHALLVVRSKNTTLNNVKMYRCGSVGTFYSMSSDNTILNNCYASPMSLGYAAYAFDSWAGDSSISGFSQHYAEVNNCYTDNNGAKYGSKNGILSEDKDVVCVVNGGVYKDSYANKGSHTLGAAFGASSSTTIVKNAKVDNCASIGFSSNTTKDTTTLNIENIIATNLRTSVHIQRNKVFGNSDVKYTNCKADVLGSKYWSEPELSISSVVANMKNNSHLTIKLNNCFVTGADTLAINTKACYGGIQISGGKYILINRLFDSAGWGGSKANSNEGFVIKNNANFFIKNNKISHSIVSPNKNALSVIKNRDKNGTYTYQYIHLAYNCSLTALGKKFYKAFDITTQGNKLLEKRLNDMKLTNCYDTQLSVKKRVNKKIIYKGNKGHTGQYYRMIFLFPENRINVKAFFDNKREIRYIKSAVSAIDISHNDLRQEFYVTGTTLNMTQNFEYNTILMN